MLDVIHANNLMFDFLLSSNVIFVLKHLASSCRLFDEKIQQTQDRCDCFSKMIRSQGIFFIDTSVWLFLECMLVVVYINSFTKTDYS